MFQIIYETLVNIPNHTSLVGMGFVAVALAALLLAAGIGAVRQISK